MATRAKKPKCDGKTSQSCGMSCISREDTCREAVAADVASRLVAIATQYKQANDYPGGSFDTVMSQFPPKLLKAAHKTGVATSDLGNGAVLTTKEAVGLDGSTIKYGFVTEADGKRYTVSDGLVKEVTGAAGSEWEEAFQAAVRSKIAIDKPKAEPETSSETVAKVAKTETEPTKTVSDVPEGETTAGVDEIAEIRTTARMGDANRASSEDVARFLPKQFSKIILSETRQVRYKAKPEEAIKLLEAELSTKSFLPKEDRDSVSIILNVVEKDMRPETLKALQDRGGKRISGGRMMFPGSEPLSDTETRIAINSKDMADKHQQATRDLESIVRLERGTAPNPEEMKALVNSHIKATDELFVLQDSTFERKPSANSADLDNKLIQEAASWAVSQGFSVGVDVNGFSADAAKAHDIAHPATHRLVGMGSEDIHKSFGSLRTASGKPSLIAEEALVNAVEHLSRGDTLGASIQNALRLAKVQSRSGTEEEKAYVRTPEFANKVIDLIANKAFMNNDFTPTVQVVRKYNLVSGTVTASGGSQSNTTSSAG